MLYFMSCSLPKPDTTNMLIDKCTSIICSLEHFIQTCIYSLLFYPFFLLCLNKKQNYIKPLKHNFPIVHVYFTFKATTNPN